MESHDLIIALLSVAFGLWAGVVAWIGHGIRADLKLIAFDLRDESRKLNSYIIQTEKRLAVLEDRMVAATKGWNKD